MKIVLPFRFQERLKKNATSDRKSPKAFLSKYLTCKEDAPAGGISGIKGHREMVMEVS